MSEYGDNTSVMTASMPAKQLVGKPDKQASTSIPSVRDYDIIGNTGHTYMVVCDDGRGLPHSIRRFNTMTEAKAAVAELKACPDCAVGHVAPHYASSRCMCGQRNHCTCDTCF